MTKEIILFGTQFSKSEWERLCDGCGLCCLYKIQDEDTDEVSNTDIICPFLNIGNGLCSVYPERFTKMPTCSRVGPNELPIISTWLPRHCAYRRVFEEKPLPTWHPLFQAADEEAKALREKLAALSTRIIEKDQPLLTWEEIIQFRSRCTKMETIKPTHQQLFDHVIDWDI